MALTGDQMARCNEAISAARVNVAEQERIYGFGYLFPTKEQRTAAAMRETLTQIETIYAALLSDATPIASEAQVAEVIRNAAELAAPGFAPRMNATPTTIGDAAGQAVDDLADVLASGGKLLVIALLVGGAILLVKNAKGAASAFAIR